MVGPFTVLLTAIVRVPKILDFKLTVKELLQLLTATGKGATVYNELKRKIICRNVKVANIKDMLILGIGK